MIFILPSLLYAGSIAYSAYNKSKDTIATLDGAGISIVNTSKYSQSKQAKLISAAQRAITMTVGILEPRVQKYSTDEISAVYNKYNDRYNPLITEAVIIGLAPAISNVSRLLYYLNDMPLVFELWTGRLLFEECNLLRWKNTDTSFTVSNESCAECNRVSEKYIDQFAIGTNDPYVLYDPDGIAKIGNGKVTHADWTTGHPLLHKACRNFVKNAFVVLRDSCYYSEVHDSSLKTEE